MSSPKPEIKITKEILIYENKYGKLFDDEVLFTTSNSKGTYIRWKWKAPYSVAILPITPNNEIILINNFRHSARKNILEVPKGYGEKKHEPLYIAKKELKEETGYVSTSYEYLGEVFNDGAFSYHIMHMFIARDCIPGKSGPEEYEVISNLELIPLKNIEEYLMGGIIGDSVTLLLLNYLYAKGG